jgi:galactonate dehydratase
MRVTEVRAWPIRVPGPDDGLMATTGIAERPDQRRSSGYRIVPPYRCLFSDSLETTIVRITTDVGIVGVGEAQAPVGPEVSATVVNRLLAPLVEGADPTDVDVLWHRMYDAMRDRGQTGGFMLDAISAVDCALWDAIGKAFGVPVHRLLGGRYRDRLPLYVSGISGKTREERLGNTVAHLEQGFGAFKMIIGLSPAEDLAEARAMRETVGPAVQLMADAHWMYDVPTAIAVGRGLEELGFRWLEAPTAPEDVRGYAEIAAALAMAVSEGETKRTRFELRPFLEARAIDLVQPDTGRAGGISECRRIAALAETHHLPYAPHLGLSMGLYTAASVQLAAATPNFLIFEYQPSVQRWANELLTEPFVAERGHFAVPDRPGLGTDVRWDRLEPYTVRL